MTATWRAVGCLVAIAVTWGIVLLSRLGIQVAPEEEALLRLSWRANAERTERCRPLSEEEQASLPAHMRRTEICEGGLASFRLAVTVDGETRVDRELRPAGVREDRPTYVLEVLPIAPGPHRLEVVFEVVGESERAPLAVAGAIDLAPRDVLLVTRDERGELVMR